MPSFIHDVPRRIVYRMLEPKAEPQRSGRNQMPTGWIITAEIEETRVVPETHLETSATCKRVLRSSEFTNPPSSSANIAIGKFLVRGKPRGDAISEADYYVIRAQYEADFNAI